LIDKTPGRAAFRLAADQALAGVRPLSGNRYKIDLMLHAIVRALEMAGDVR
jgi:xanthine dehydrogenase YagS FAD-binding subunit